MKFLNLLFFLFWFSSFPAMGQENYCKYFKLKMRFDTTNKAIYVSPEIQTIEGDAFSQFVQRYKRRFEYILFNRIDSLSKFTKLYPDTAAIASRFCQHLSENKTPDYYFKILSNTNPYKKPVFSVSEMMLIASRFFLCDEVKADTSIGYHICIGINGQKELESNKDFTVLEAFCFEAIFNRIEEEGTPQFLQNFRNYISASSKKFKNELPDTDAYLESVKQECYLLMQYDISLKEALLKYYSENKSGCGFEIR